MNTKKIKHYKSARKGLGSKAKDGKTEIFVLPPNLLQKLGIDLGNVKIPQECPTESINKGDTIIVHKEPDILVNRESMAFDTCRENEEQDTHQKFTENDPSMLETANLMKKSVFLSPTFISEDTHVIPEDLKLTSTQQLETYSSHCKNYEVSTLRDSVMVEEIPTFNNSKEYIAEYKGQSLEIENFASQKTQTSKDTNVLLNMTQSVIKNVSENIPIDTLNSRVTIEKEVHDYSLQICNQGTSDSKVNILSEEILSLSRSNELKKLYSPKVNDLVPVTINTVIQKNKMDNIIDKVVLNQQKYFGIAAPFTENQNPSESVNSPNISSILSKSAIKDCNKKKNASTMSILSVDLPLNVIPEPGVVKSTCHNKSQWNTTNDSQYSNKIATLFNHQEITINTSKLKTNTADNSFSVDVYGDIEKHLQEENDNSLEKIVNEISINSANEILDSMKNCEIDLYSNKAMSNELEVSQVHQHSIEGASSLSGTNIEVQGIQKNTILFDNGLNTFNESKYANLRDKLCQDHSICQIGNESGRKLNTVIEENLQYEENNLPNMNIDKPEKYEQPVLYFEDNSSNVTTHSNCFPDSQFSAIKNISDIENNSIKHIKTKLCIQGVEKPGGVFKSDMVFLKTYGRSNKVNECSSSIPVQIRENGCRHSNDISDNVQNVLNNICFSNLNKTDEFCLCSDFGRLTYYDCEGEYQHIHFWNRTDINNGIYNNQYSDGINNEDMNASFEIVNKDLKINAHGICWNIMENCAINTASKENKEITLSNVVKPSTNEKVTTWSVKGIDQVGDDILKYRHRNKMRTQNKESHNISIETAKVNSTMENYHNQDMCAEISIQDKLKIPEKNSYVIQNENVEQQCNKKTVNEKCSNHTTAKEHLFTISVPTEDSCEQNSQNIPVEKCDNNIYSKNDMKRKMSSDREFEEPPNKKHIKCCVCGKLVADKEWKDHVSNDHCYIAWGEGNSFDFQDPKLIRNLEDKLSQGSLKCTFCSGEENDANMFLEHVYSCFKNKNIQHDYVGKVIKGENTDVKCGVCGQTIECNNWGQHIAKEHDYLAWEEGDTPVDVKDRKQVQEHLIRISKMMGGLVCPVCGLVRKYVDPYLRHVERCRSGVKCAVCKGDVKADDWIDHISKEHDYLAWKHGEPSPNFDDPRMLYDYLFNILQTVGSLKCSKCECIYKYVDDYLHHVKSCEGPSAVKSKRRKSQLENCEKKKKPLSESIQVLIKCGVCQKEVKSNKWIHHIHIAHNYLAWKEGENLNLDDADEVQKHLYHLSKKLGGLTCSKCGVVKKYVKSYLHHVETCDRKATIDFTDSDEENTNKEKLVCGVCSEQVERRDWKNHRMQNHYNMAWTVDDAPIDLKSFGTVQRFLNEYKAHYRKLVCNICGASRTSCMGFYAHVLTCGKTDEEVEPFKNLCPICNKKYLCIYHSQHMLAHKEQALAEEKKMQQAEQQENVENKDATPSGRRRAAEKARTVIEKYTSEHNCTDCGFSSDVIAEREKHNCKKTRRESSDSDVTIKSESEDESLDTDIESNLSEEQDSQILKKKSKECAPVTCKIAKVPFTVKKPSIYLTKSGEEYCKFHFSSEVLYPEWQVTEYEAVLEDEILKYLPALEQSCQVRFSDSNWKTYNRFEAKTGDGYSLFVGGCIQNIRWVPPLYNAEGGSYNNYLSVTCHRGEDCPRYLIDELPQHPALIQIWDFGNFKTLPKLVLGIAHDYGTVWVMDWCPSGARQVPELGKPNSRLGLLAVACSNGLAYIFSVPYPAAITEGNKLFYKLKPVVELRFSMGSHRKMYQATSITWSPQHLHTCIIVGYADGSTAYYDLNTDSPLLKSKEDDVIILYPYYDERSHNSCVTGVSSYPSAEGSWCVGAACSASPTGAAAAVRPAARPARLRTHVPCADAVFQPLWPATLVAGDDNMVNTSPNELDWFGGARRFGPVTACSGCVHCGCVATFMSPLLRALQPHPVYAELKKPILGTLQMKRLNKKRRKVAEDDLVTRIEPVTYDEAVKKYGIELVLDKNYRPPPNKPRDQFPERFPLADVPSMAFCPSPAHHNRLAVATHSGLIFLITV